MWSGAGQAAGAEAVDDDVGAHMPGHHDATLTWGAWTRRSSMSASEKPRTPNLAVL
jgi:hypothetical protein